MRKRKLTKSSTTCKHRYDEERGLDHNGNAIEGKHHFLLSRCFLRKIKSTKCDNPNKSHKNCMWTKHYSQYKQDAR